MKNKLKHLSKYCCSPANETEFEAVKMAAELGGVDWFEEDAETFNCLLKPFIISSFNEFNDTIDYPFIVLDEENSLICYTDADGRQLISTLGFIKKLRMTEEKAMELEDDRVEFILFKDYLDFSDDSKTLIALNSHYFKTNEDGTEVTLHKKDVK